MIHRINPALILAAMVTLTLLFTQASYASDGFYTIQAGTYDYRPYAVEQLDLIKNTLRDNHLTYVRVIQFREIFSVRVGRFPNHAAANRHLRAIRTLYPDAFILSVKRERVSHVLEEPPPSTLPGKEDIPGKNPAIIHEKAEGLIEFYTIQAGTYDYRPYAVEQLTFIRENLGDNDLTYLRVIEFRELFAVRAGRFPDHAAANRHLSAIRTLYPDAFILSVKNEKISHVLKDPPVGDPITSHNKAKELIGKEEYGKALNLLSPF
ncbi:MAG: hypothetical protein GQ522_02975, partial [Deltaproteobacteria bacterium]|nr:hypothetical protein [Deltaproteobacteria bacterium]